MITKIHGVYHGICDICGEEKTEPRDDWYAAKEAMYQAGCRRQEENGEYHDVCRECSNKI